MGRRRRVHRRRKPVERRGAEQLGPRPQESSLRNSRRHSTASACSPSWRCTTSSIRTSAWAPRPRRSPRTGRRTCCPPIRTARTISATTSTASTRTSSTSDSTRSSAAAGPSITRFIRTATATGGTPAKIRTGPTPNGTPYGATMFPEHLLTNDYRSWGDTLNLQDDFSFGDLKTGGWIDRQFNVRGLANTDETLNDAFVESVPGSVVSAYYGGRLLNQELMTLQGYVQFDWIAGFGSHPVTGRALRFLRARRRRDRQRQDRQSADYDNTFDSTLPSLLAHYMITRSLVGLCAGREGLSRAQRELLQLRGAGLDGLEPAADLELSGRVELAEQTGCPSRPTCTSSTSTTRSARRQSAARRSSTTSGARHTRAVEAEGTYYVGSGFSVYANGSVNSAKDNATGHWVPFAPDFTAALGAIYNLHGWYGSLIDKWVGRTYDDAGQTIPDRLVCHPERSARLQVRERARLAPRRVGQARLRQSAQQHEYRHVRRVPPPAARRSFRAACPSTGRFRGAASSRQ